MNTDKINQAKDAIGEILRAQNTYLSIETLNKINAEIIEAIRLIFDCPYHQSAIEEAGRELIRELKETDETLGAKLRNALSPHYGLPSTISKLREHPELLKIVEDMSDQAIKNNLRIDTILNAIDEQLSTLTTSRGEWKLLSEEKIVENVKLKKDFDICKRSHDAVIELSEIQNKSFIELKQENDELRKEAKGLKGIVGQEVLIKRSIEKDGLPKKNDTYLVENSSHSDLCEFSDGKFLYQRMNIDYWYEPAIFPLLPVKEVGERQDREKLVFDLLNKHLPKDTKWDIETEQGVQNAMKELYNQLSTPLPTKQSTGFRLGDIEECLQQMRMGLGLYGLYNAESCKKWAGEYFNKLISLPHQSTKNLSLDGAGKIIKMARAFSYRENGTIVFENSEDQIIQFLTTIEHTEVK